MKQNSLGELCPAKADEIGFALEDLHIDPSLAMVIISEEADGFFAEVIADDGMTFQAGPFETKAAVISALSENGIKA